MNVVPKTIGGILHNLNKSASDWGWPSLLAYGCQTAVVVVDTKTVQVIQTLEKHKSQVTRVKWARENYHHTIESPYTLRLASADTSGNIIVWDVSEACERSSFSEGNKPVLEMEWLSTQDASHDLLVALHPPYSIILWNVATGTKLWKKTFTDNILSVTFDPFDPSNLTLLGNDCILFVNDFSITKAPSSNGRKFYITSPSSVPIPTNSSSNVGTTAEKKNGGKPKGAFKRVRLLVGDNKPKSGEGSSIDVDPISLNDCIQLCYLQSCRHHLLLLYSREILILDLEINQTVGTIPMERSGSPFQMVYPCRQRDVLVCMHENGSISVRVRRNGQSANLLVSAATPIDQIGSFSNFHGETGSSFDQLEIIYDLRCQSDPLRVTKHVRAFSIAVCSSTERSIALVMSDGRILFWNLITIDYIPSTISNTHSQLVLTPLFSPGYSSDSNGEFEFLPPIKSPQKSQTAAPYPKLCLSDLIGHAQTLGTEAKQGHEVILKFVLTGLLSGVGLMPTVIRMCPPLTTKNITYHQPLVAVGTSTGLVQVFNVSTGALIKEYNIHISNIRGIEWINLNSFFSFSHPNPNNNGLVRNELLLLDLQTGRTTSFRKEKGEESPIEAVKVSHLKLYFIIMFKEKAFEVWDLKSCTMLREMPANFPIITALEWSPSHNVKNLKKRQQALHESTSGNLPVKDATPTSSHILDTIGVHTGTKSNSPSIAREHFVFTDNNGLLYHFIVEGSTVKDGSKMPPESGMGSVTCIAWKQDLMVLGDTEGNLNLWDIKGKISRNVPTHRGWLKKLKFAPGKGNMRLMILWNDGVDIWDTNSISRISGLRGNKESFKVLDSDWASSDKPIVLTEDGCLRVYDVEFRITCTALSHSVLPEPVFCPHLLTAKAGLAMKYTIQHQAWNDSYTLELSSEYETPENENIIEVVNAQMNLLPMEIQSYLASCPYGTAQRCLFAANLFGDEAEMNFWTVALYYLKSEQARLSCTIHKNSTELAATPSTSDIYLPGDPLDPMHIAGGSDLLLMDRKEDVIKQCTCLKEPSLDCCYDTLCTNQSYKRYQLERLCLHDSKRATYAHTKKCAESLMLLGQTDRAVQLFLETESENDSYYVDLLRACLVATIRSSGASQSTIKLVATSLIANGRLSEGVQLLCLIDKGLDACRYLQTYGQWNQAVWLAKATLSYAECCEVLKRWVDYLCTPNVNQKSMAILLLLSMGRFRRVLEMLMSLHFYDRAAMLAEACSEFGVLPEDKVTRNLLEKIYIEYARYLLSLGNKKGYGYFCNKAAEKAKKVITDLEWS